MTNSELGIGTPTLVRQAHRYGEQFYRALVEPREPDLKVRALQRLLSSLPNPEALELILQVTPLVLGNRDLELPLLRTLTTFPVPSMTGLSRFQGLLFTLGRRHPRYFRRILWEEIDFSDKQRRHRALTVLALLGPGIRRRETFLQLLVNEELDDFLSSSQEIYAFERDLIRYGRRVLMGLLLRLQKEHGPRQLKLLNLLDRILSEVRLPKRELAKYTQQLLNSIRVMGLPARQQLLNFYCFSRRSVPSTLRRAFANELLKLPSVSSGGVPDQRLGEALVRLGGPGLRTLTDFIVGQGLSSSVPARRAALSILRMLISSHLLGSEEHARFIRGMGRRLLAHLKKFVTQTQLGSDEKLLLAEMAAFLGFLSTSEAIRREFIEKLAAFLLDHLWEFAKTPEYFSGLTEILCGHRTSERARQRGILLLVNLLGRRCDDPRIRHVINGTNVQEQAGLAWLEPVIRGLTRLFLRLPAGHELRPLILGVLLSKWEKIYTLAELWHPSHVYALLTALADLGCSHKIGTTEKERIFTALCGPLQTGAMFPMLAEAIARILHTGRPLPQGEAVAQTIVQKILAEWTPDSEEIPDGFVHALYYLVRGDWLDSRLRTEATALLKKYRLNFQ